MCVLCSVLWTEDHWAEVSAEAEPAESDDTIVLEVHMANRGRRLRDRALRARFANLLLGGYGLQLQDWEGSSYIVRDSKGSSAVVTERNGTQHSVHLAGNTERLAAQLTQSNVIVSVEPQGGLPINIHWGFLLIAVVYLAVVILVVGSIVAAGVYFVRQLLTPRAG